MTPPAMTAARTEELAVSPLRAVVVPFDRSGPDAGIAPGDILLSRAHGILHPILRWGQRLRIPGGDKSYADYTHAALVVSASGDLIEAVGDGVRASTLLQYVVDREVFQVVHVESCDHDRAQVVAFARAVLAARAPYGFLTNWSIALWAFTGSRLTFFLDGSFTCSGLVASALQRTTTEFTVSPVRTMPAQLAKAFGAPAPPAAARRPRTRRWTRSDGCRPRPTTHGTSADR